MAENPLELIAQGEKKLKSGFFSSAKPDEAAEYFTKAGNIYKMQKKGLSILSMKTETQRWLYELIVDEAANCYMRAANCYLTAKSGHDAANSFMNAANVYRKTNPLGNNIRLFGFLLPLPPASNFRPLIFSFTEAVKCLEKCCEFYAQEGRWSMAAKNMKEIAEILEKEAQIDKAMAAYEKAAEYYEGDNAP